MKPHLRPTFLLRFRVRFLALTLLACPPLLLAVPSIKIDSVTPDGPWMPGDQGQITVGVTYTDAPWPARVDFIVREVGETITKEFDPNASTSVSFDARAASKSLRVERGRSLDLLPSPTDPDEPN